MSSLELARQACEDAEAVERAIMDQLDEKPRTTKVNGKEYTPHVACSECVPSQYCRFLFLVCSNACGNNIT